mmetsp:Transcript_23587/g.59468  ORF Transcript_23587/g.59468 Transcript_23587/m.59468 type:complete len:158 (-) Transcript_23587:244-717(-)|eukprot:CAMPEP_0113906602 /NCGR_PEP_ID=MMETSP0780_2-20120614/24882_1 /TAXON_ID=652834 /ORGANISM="Palpitomonas bilix" /LENGTH=157 /DNA_ID=CAMNT_0000901307 /DNA_START=140 /DNA_END=613 /DNA_ORIENTATION=+ /assembly_acc=CAM_ASM_000599
MYSSPGYAVQADSPYFPTNAPVEDAKLEKRPSFKLASPTSPHGAEIEARSPGLQAILDELQALFTGEYTEEMEHFFLTEGKVFQEGDIDSQKASYEVYKSKFSPPVVAILEAHGETLELFVEKYQTSKDEIVNQCAAMLKMHLVFEEFQESAKEGWE